MADVPTKFLPLLRCDSGEIGGYEFQPQKGNRGMSCSPPSLVEWIGEVTADELPRQGFLLVSLSNCLSTEQIASVAVHLDRLDLRERLCLAYRQVNHHSRKSIEYCHTHGIRILLDDVGLQTRLGDICQLGTDAIRLDTEIVEQMSGCPRSAAAAAAAICLAQDVGMLTLAHYIDDEFSRAQLVSAGIEYMGISTSQTNPLPQVFLSQPATCMR